MRPGGGCRWAVPEERVDANMAALAPEELMKNWMAFGAGAQEQFMKLMATAAGTKPGK